MNQNLEQLTPRQFKFLVALHILGTSLISIPAGLISSAKQDAWIAFLIAIIADLAFLLLFTALGRLDPSQSIPQIAENLLGKWFGGFYCINMVLYGLSAASELVWYLSNFLKEFSAPIPTFYINFLFVLIISLTLTSGLKVLGRLTELCFPVIVAVIVLIFLSLLPSINLDQLFPIFDNPIKKIFKASLKSTTYIGAPCINLLAFYPYRITKQKNPHWLYFTGYLYGSSLLLVIILLSILTIGNAASNVNNGTYVLTMLVNLKNILERSGGFLALIWFTTLFFKTITYYSYGIVHLAQLLKIKNEKSFSLALGLIILVYAPVVYRDNIQEAIWDTTTWSTYIIPVCLLLPLILLIVGKLKKTFTHQKGTP